MHQHRSPAGPFRRIAAVAAAGALAASLSLIGATSASAATSGAPASMCFSVKLDHNAIGQPRATVHSDCGATHRVKVVWGRNPDSPCTTLAPGRTFRDTAGIIADFDGLQYC